MARAFATFRFVSRLIWVLLLLNILILPVHGDNSFNYDINARVQDNIGSFLLKIAQAGDITELQLNSKLIKLSDFKAGITGWTAGASLYFRLKRVLMHEIILVQLGNLTL